LAAAQTRSETKTSGRLSLNSMKNAYESVCAARVRRRRCCCAGAPG
jgi:hypothetical protein